jgi:hypothetical protein
MEQRFKLQTPVADKKFSFKVIEKDTPPKDIIPKGLPQGYGAEEEKGFDATQGRVSAVGITMNLDFHPKMLDKSGVLSSQVNFNNIFNEGDVSMMDEMNKLLSGLQYPKGEFNAVKKFRLSEGDGMATGRFKGSDGDLTPNG